MKLNDIHYFIVIAEEKNISSAASRLYISQPALSQFLQKLERELNTNLFTRTEKGLSLTEAGRIYLNGCYHMASIAEALDFPD